MRTHHLLQTILDHPSVTLIPLQLIKIRQMPTRPIVEKTKDLLKNIPNRLPLLAPPQIPKPIAQKTININLA